MRLNYTLFGVLLLLWSGCDFSEPEPEIEPPTVVEKDPVDIKVFIETVTNDKTYDYIDLLGRGFDCKKSTIKGYINVKGKVIDVERLLAGDGYDYVKQEPIKLYPYSTVEIFLLYNGGGWVISENRDLNKYIDYTYLNSQVETKIGDDVLRLFTEDIGNIEENLQGNYFHKAECFHPTSRYTLPHVWPHYLCFFLSKEFLNDLEKSNGDEIVKKYGTHVLTDVLLGGYTSLSYVAQYSYMLSDVDFRKRVQAYTNYFNASRYPLDVNPIFEECSKVNIHFKANGGNPSHFVAEGDKIMGFDKWIKEINNQVGTLIGIGQSTTHIFLISDFVKDEKKKTEIEKAILRYCNQ